MSKLKELALNLTCRYVLKPRRGTNLLPQVRQIDCTQNDIAMLVNTSNNILRIAVGNTHVYFRECKQHTKIHPYVAAEIEYYYTRLHPELSDDRAYIERSLTDKRNFKKFVNMGMTNDSSSRAYHFCVGHGAHFIGLDGMPPDMETRVKDFVQFVWGDLFAYRLNSGVRNGDYQTYHAIRSIATYRLAELLGLKDMVPKTEYAKLCIDGETILLGTVMEEAGGISPDELDASARSNACSPALQRALNNLNVLDGICHEKDHRPGNYNVILNAGKGVNVVAFDNDSPNSFGIGGISFETYVGCSPWVVNGQINRPYIDAELAERILEIRGKDLYNALGDLLNIYQLVTLKSRVRKTQKVLKQTPRGKLMQKECWSEDTIREELSGGYGKTYLAKFLEWQAPSRQPWIKDAESRRISPKSADM